MGSAEDPSRGAAHRRLSSRHQSSGRECATDTTLRFELLGPLRVWRGSAELDLGPVKQRAVLAALLVTANRPVTTAAIIDAVWRDDPPENGANVVQKYVAGLRRVLEPDRAPRSPGEVLALTDAGYVLTVEPENIDAELFHRTVRLAGDQPDRASALLDRAFELWRGTPLPGLSGPLFDSARDRLLEARAAAVQTWAEIEIGRGNHGPVVARLRELVVEFPLREELRYLLILGLDRAGRRAEALAAYRDARQLLIDELGVEPGERLRHLHLSILQADAQAPPPAPGPAVPPQWTPLPGTPASLDAPVASGPAAIRPERRSMVGRVLAIVIPVATFGLAGWTVIAYYAIHQRSRVLGVAAAGYLTLVAASAALLVRNAEAPADSFDAVGVVLFAASIFGPAVHGLVLSSGPGAGGPPGAVAVRVRREQARQVVRDHPAIAVALRIGRPDLPRTFDDGGLIDANAVPEALLAALPGIGPERARRIVADRTTHGPLATVEDLVYRELIPGDVLRDLADTVIVLPVEAAPLMVPSNPVSLAVPRPAAHNGYSALP